MLRYSTRSVDQQPPAFPGSGPTHSLTPPAQSLSFCALGSAVLVECVEDPRGNMGDSWLSLPGVCILSILESLPGVEVNKSD